MIPKSVEPWALVKNDESLKTADVPLPDYHGVDYVSILELLT